MTQEALLEQGQKFRRRSGITVQSPISLEQFDVMVAQLQNLVQKQQNRILDKKEVQVLVENGNLFVGFEEVVQVINGKIVPESNTDPNTE